MLSLEEISSYQTASAVNAIVFSKPVLKDVVIVFQHCKELDEHIPKQAVVFASAHSISSGVGYKFNPINDGVLILKVDGSDCEDDGICIDVGVDNEWQR